MKTILLVVPTMMPLTDYQAPPTVLLVDDEACLIAAFKRSLRHEPFRVLAAYSAEEALEILENNHVDVIVSDDRMPGMNGTQLLARAFEIFPKTVRILFTGDAHDVSPSDTERGIIHRILLKPCKLTEFAAAVRETLQQQATA